MVDELFDSEEMKRAQDESKVSEVKVTLEIKLGHSVFSEPEVGTHIHSNELLLRFLIELS